MKLKFLYLFLCSFLFGTSLSAEEKKLALKGRDFANKMFRAAEKIEFANLKWDKYGGRVLVDVYLDGKLYKDEIINAGLARPYDGGTKESWCE